MEGQMYVPVKAESTNVSMMSLAGSDTSMGGEMSGFFTIKWNNIGGITGNGWKYKNVDLVSPAVEPNDTQEQVINKINSARTIYNYTLNELKDYFGSTCVVF